MLSAHRDDLPELIQRAERALTQIESRLLASIDADESSQLVEQAVDLTTEILELKNSLNDLTEEDSPQRAR